MSRFYQELSYREEEQKDSFIEECISDPTLRDKLSLVTRSFMNRMKVGIHLFLADIYDWFFAKKILPTAVYLKKTFSKAELLFTRRWPYNAVIRFMGTLTNKE